MTNIQKLITAIGVLVVTSLFFIPTHASASIVSFFEDILSDKAEAAVEYPSFSLMNMPVLEVLPNPDLGLARGGNDVSIIDDSVLLPEVGVSGTLADIENSHPTQISLYVVRKGDTLSAIAKMFGVSVNTIIWANNIGKSIQEGDRLVILPVSGINHTIVKGDTLKSIATKYKADASEIAQFNGIESASPLKIGSAIIIPDGEMTIASPIKSTTQLRKAGGPVYEGYYIRPVTNARKTQGLHGYNGIDLGAQTGTPVMASAGGTVIIARGSGWNGGYGNYVVISHPNGTQTLYAHLSRVYVSQGQAIAQGDQLGGVGSTGRSTGPHLHFEIRGATNPF